MPAVASFDLTASMSLPLKPDDQYAEMNTRHETSGDDTEHDNAIHEVTRDVERKDVERRPSNLTSIEQNDTTKARSYFTFWFLTRRKTRQFADSIRSRPYSHKLAQR